MNAEPTEPAKIEPAKSDKPQTQAEKPTVEKTENKSKQQATEEKPQQKPAKEEKPVTEKKPAKKKTKKKSSRPKSVNGIVIKQGRLQYKSFVFKFPIDKKEVFKAFGDPSREIYNVAGTVLIWDDLGVACYGCDNPLAKYEQETQRFNKERTGGLEVVEEKKKKSKKKKSKYSNVQSEPVSAIVIYIKKYNPYPELEKRYSHEPRKIFPGRLELDGVHLDGEKEFSDFVEQRNSTQTILLPDNGFSFFIRCEPKPHEITVHSIRDKYHEDYLKVYSVSVRNIAHYYKDRPCIDHFKWNQKEKKQEEDKRREENEDELEREKQQNRKDLPAPVSESTTEANQDE